MPANLARAAAKLPPPTLPQLTLPMAGLRIDLAQGNPSPSPSPSPSPTNGKPLK